MRLYVALVMTALATGAQASGGLSCTASDKAAQFSLDGGVSRGMGGALFSFNGSIAIRAQGVPDDLRRLKFSREHVAQYRLNACMLALTLYRERTGNRPHGYVELDVEARPSDGEGGYAGVYRLTIFEASGNGSTVTREGKVSCMAE